MNATGRGHVAIVLPKANYSAVTGTAQEEQIGTVGVRIVARFNFLISLNLSLTFKGIPTCRIPRLEALRILLQGLPNFNQWLKRIRGFCLPWSQNAKHTT